MSAGRRFKTMMIGLTATAICVPQQWAAANDAAPRTIRQQEASAPADVALSAGGVLRGQVVDAQGLPAANEDVSVMAADGAVMQSKTDSDGNFRVAGLRGGAYAVATSHSNSGYRLWANGAAPPGAKSSILIVEQQAIVRGNCSSCGPGGLLGGGGSRGGLLMLGLAGGIVAGGIIAQDRAAASGN